MPNQFNLARVTTATTGTGTITLGAAVSGYLTFALARVGNGAVVSYGIKDGANSEIGVGTYTAAGTTLTRTVTNSTASDALISLSGTAEVFITARAEDLFSDPVAGRLSYVSATAIKFVPHAGEMIRINGSIYPIPAAGIAGVANTSVFVNGVGATNLAASTFYYVYAFINAGVVTADFRTDGAGHLPSDTVGNIGTEVRVSAGTTKDDTRTLIGMVRTNASSQFADSATTRFVRSWFNRRSAVMANHLTVTTNAGATIAEISATEGRVEFLVFSDEAIDAKVTGSFWNSVANQGIIAAISFDGGTVEFGGTKYISPNASQEAPLAAAALKTGLSEGYHYVTLFGRHTGGATATFNGSTSSDSSATTIHAMTVLN